MCLCWFIGEIRDVPLMLYVPLLTPCLDSEKLCIAVDLMKGTFLVSLAHKGLIASYGVSVIIMCMKYVLFAMTVLI